ncbi:signal transduction histidine kinase [Prauserella sediminis]|uniref:Signal transduction histidine kinase n=1 Tax=Prauserella sediminis TaxID=577680 RepID=A0A839XJE9_9PSEU|nr:histidine kinase [Prauserella sediminis]MBB3664062.1 signal transduction histidine kinase [Prauserella sediminis]
MTSSAHNGSTHTGSVHTGFGRDEADLGALTGVRSGKRSFYPEYVRSAERLENAVRALDRISRALVRTAEGPRELVEAVVHAAAEHLHAEWLLVAVADGALQAARPRFLVLHGGELIDDERSLPAEALPHLHVLRGRPWEAEDEPGDGIVRVSMTLDGEPIGGIAGLPGKTVDVADTDLAILRVLANQAAVALHNSFLLHAATTLRGRTEQLSEAAEQQAKELAETQQRLIESMQRQALDDERHRIARELHDSVTQDVLSAGMTVEVCRAELAASGVHEELVDQLSAAKDLTGHAVERLRAAIYALHNGAEEPPGSLPVLLERLSSVHLPSDLKVQVRIAGTPVPLPGEVEHSLLRLAGEALFNTVMHTTADEALVRLQYLPERIVLSISDDGEGDPAQLRRTLKLTAATDLAGVHRGLANMQDRTHELGGTMSIRRSELGGIMLVLDIPLPLRRHGKAAP